MEKEDTSEFRLWNLRKTHELEASGSSEGWGVEKVDSRETVWNSPKEEFRPLHSPKFQKRISQILKLFPSDTQQKIEVHSLDTRNSQEWKTILKSGEFHAGLHTEQSYPKILSPLFHNFSNRHSSQVEGQGIISLEAQ